MMENPSKDEAAAPNSETKQRARELPEKDDAANEQPRKKAKKEDQAKCSKCNKRLARRGMFVLLFERNMLPFPHLLMRSFFTL